MDSLTHLFLTRKLIGEEFPVLLAGVAPDVPFYFMYPEWLLVTGQLQRALKTNIWPEPPNWMTIPHHALHSIPVLFLFGLTVRLWTGNWLTKVMKAWLLHILIDLPTHSRQNWAPQFLWPLSTMTINGISWAEIALAILTRNRNPIRK